MRNPEHWWEWPDGRKPPADPATPAEAFKRARLALAHIEYEFAKIRPGWDHPRAESIDEELETIGKALSLIEAQTTTTEENR